MDLISKMSNWITDQIYDTLRLDQPEHTGLDGYGPSEGPPSGLETKLMSNSDGTRKRSREEVEYGAYMAISEVLKVSVLLILAAVLNVFWSVVGIVLIFGLLRWNLGGIHAKTHTACMISYFCFVYGTLAASILIPDIRLVFDLIVIPFAFIVAYLYAPADMPVKPVVSKKQRKRLRITGFILLAVLFALAQFLPIIWFNIIMLTSALAGTLLTPPIYKLTGNEYGRKEVSI